MLENTSSPYCATSLTLFCCVTSKSDSRASIILCKNRCVNPCEWMAWLRLRNVGFCFRDEASGGSVDSRGGRKSSYISATESLHHCIRSRDAKEDSPVLVSVLLSVREPRDRPAISFDASLIPVVMTRLVRRANVINLNEDACHNLFRVQSYQLSRHWTPSTQSKPRVLTKASADRILVVSFHGMSKKKNWRVNKFRQITNRSKRNEDH